MNKKLQITLAVCCLTAHVALSQVNITPGGIYTENFDGLGASTGTWTDNSTLGGWYAAVTNLTSGAVTLMTTHVNTQGAGNNSSTLYNIGPSGDTERALGFAPSTSNNGMLGWRLANAGSTVISNLTIVYDGEQWRANGASRFTVSYKIFAAGAGALNSLGGWISAPSSLVFVSPTSGAGSLDGNNPTNRMLWLTATLSGLSIAPSEEIWIKWTFSKISGENIACGIDNARVAVDLGAPPTIGAIPTITVMSTQTSTNANFTVADAEEGAPSGPVTAVASSNPAAVPLGNVLFGGSGANRSVYISPAGSPGSSVVTVGISDSQGNLVQKTFNVTVLPLNYTPSVTTPPPTNTLANVPVPVEFAVGDAETAASGLIVNAEVASYSSGILSSVSLGSDGSGTNRVAIVTPVDGANGIGVVNVTVSDPDLNTNRMSFAVMVRPSASVVFLDKFDYPLGDELLPASANLWRLVNASPGTYDLIMANEIGVEGKIWVRGRTSADDCAGRLVGAPYNPGSGAVLYTKWVADWVNYADQNDSPTNNGSRGATIRLLNTATPTSAGVAEMAFVTNGAAASSFRAALIDINEALVLNTFTDIAWPGSATIVTRYDVDTGLGTLWVNPISEASPSVTSIDHTNPPAINYVQIRQDTGMANIYGDSLQVSVVFKPVITSITPPVGGALDIFFTADSNQGYVPADFQIIGSSSVETPFGNKSAIITSLGGGQFKASLTGVTGGQNFYRVKVTKSMTF